MTRWIVAPLAVLFAVIQGVLVLAALLVAQDFAIALGLLASTIFFVGIGWRARQRGRLP